MAIESMQKAYARDEVRELIWAREKARLDYQSGLAYAHEQGLEQGLQQGLQQGLEQGLEKGREETTLDVARRMLSLQVGFDVIAQTTGLSQDEIRMLQAGDH